jgi:hypothetical protein
MMKPSITLYVYINYKMKQRSKSCLTNRLKSGNLRPDSTSQDASSPEALLGGLLECLVAAETP